VSAGSWSSDPASSNPDLEKGKKTKKKTKEMGASFLGEGPSNPPIRPMLSLHNPNSDLHRRGNHHTQDDRYAS
jgi:hypothetical protein